MNILSAGRKNSISRTFVMIVPPKTKIVFSLEIHVDVDGHFPVVLFSRLTNLHSIILVCLL